MHLLCYGLPFYRSRKDILTWGNISPPFPSEDPISDFFNIQKNINFFQNIKLLINTFPAIWCLCLYYVHTSSYKGLKFGHA